MDESTLPNEVIQTLRAQGVITEQEVALRQGDLMIAVNVITQQRRIIESRIEESAASKEVIEGMIEQTYKVVAFGEDARDKVKIGVEKLTDAVKVTMGPSGHNVLIEQAGAPPILTKDGVTVARAVNLKDKFANLGVQLVREAAQRTAEEAGDGTTTATVLANALYTEGSKLLSSGYSLRSLREEMQEATREICELVKSSSVPIKSDDDLRKVANISVNHEQELADLIVEAIKAVGDHGTVTVDEAKGFESSLEVVEGCEIDRGYTSPYFVNKPSRMACELQTLLF